MQREFNQRTAGIYPERNDGALIKRQSDASNWQVASALGVDESTVRADMRENPAPNAEKTNDNKASVRENPAGLCANQDLRTDFGRQHFQ